MAVRKPGVERKVRVATCFVASMAALSGACSSSGSSEVAVPPTLLQTEQIESGEAAAPAVPGVVYEFDESLDTPGGLDATVGDQGVALSWSPVGGGTGFVVRVGGEVVGVPAGVCVDEMCRVDVGDLAVAAGGEVAVSTVSGEKYGPPVVAEVPVTGTSVPSSPAPATDLVVTRLEGGAIQDPDRVPQYEVVPAGSAAEAERLASELLADPQVLEVRFNARGVLDGPSSALVGASSSDDLDEVLPAGFGLAGWQVPFMEFGSLPNAGDGVVIALIDDGVHADHPAFAGADIRPGVTIDEDLVARPDGTSNPGGHGTTTASMIIGQPDSPVRGIAPRATLLPIDIHENGSTSVGQYNTAVRWAVDNGADLIVGTTTFFCGQIYTVRFDCPRGVDESLAYAERAGVAVVASAGNHGDGAEWCRDVGLPGAGIVEPWPATEALAISVGGVNQAGQPWACQTTGQKIDISAPAEMLLVASGPDGYGFQSGTSYSAPLIAGLLAIALSADPGLNPEQLRSAIADGQDHATTGVLVHLLLRGLGVELTAEAFPAYPLSRPLALKAEIWIDRESPIWNRPARAAACEQQPDGLVGASLLCFPAQTSFLSVIGTVYLNADNTRAIGQGVLVHVRNSLTYGFNCYNLSTTAYQISYDLPMSIEADAERRRDGRLGLSNFRFVFLGFDPQTDDPLEYLNSRKTVLVDGQQACEAVAANRFVPGQGCPAQCWNGASAVLEPEDAEAFRAPFSDHVASFFAYFIEQGPLNSGSQGVVIDDSGPVDRFRVQNVRQ